MGGWPAGRVGGWVAGKTENKAKLSPTKLSWMAQGLILAKKRELKVDTSYVILISSQSVPETQNGFYVFYLSIANCSKHVSIVVIMAQNC